MGREIKISYISRTQLLLAFFSVEKFPFPKDNLQQKLCSLSHKAESNYTRTTIFRAKEEGAVYMALRDVSTLMPTYVGIYLV